jgi:hypothetical protein
MLVWPIIFIRGLMKQLSLSFFHGCRKAAKGLTALTFETDC